MAVIWRTLRKGSRTAIGATASQSCSLLHITPCIKKSKIKATVILMLYLAP